MVDFSWWGGARVTPWMRYQLDRLDADLRREFGVGLVANSGIRLAQEQLDIWYARYTRTPNGRKVYDTRWWNGQLWYRVSPDGTVAQPGSSNHEIQGTTAAVDIADTGNDAGIKSSWSTRGKWIRANAWRYDMVASGDGFGEGWHFDIRNIYNNPPGSPAGGGATPIKKEWDEMATEQDLENVVRRVLGDGKTNEHFIVSYASQTGRNGIVLAGFGYWHPLTGEQWEHFNWNGSFSPQGGGLFNGLRVFTPINDRAWDILRDICLNDGVAEGEGVDYDKIEKLVTEGKVEPVTPVIDYAQLAKAMQDAGVTNANSADIAKAVRAELASNPLK